MTVATMLRRPRRVEAPAIKPEAAVAVPRPHLDVEAPDSGDSHRPHEAPEATSRRHAEAPDTGSGRSGYIEGEFTHGRSRS